MFTAEEAWLKQAAKKAEDINSTLLKAELVNKTLSEDIKSYGIVAFMKCTTQHLANIEAATSCLYKAFMAYVEYFKKLIENISHMRCACILPYGRNVKFFTVLTERRLTRVIKALRQCMATAPVRY